MSKFKKGDRVTLGNLIGTVADVYSQYSYNVEFDGHVYEDNNARVSNRFRTDFFDAYAEKIAPSARDRLKGLAPGTVIQVKNSNGSDLWNVVFLRLATTDDPNRGQMVYGYAVDQHTARDFLILNEDTITIE